MIDLIYISLVTLFVFGTRITGCNTTDTAVESTKESTKKLTAHKKIVDYAVNNSKTAPTVEDYTNAGITGVNADNLTKINTKLNTLKSLAISNVVTKVQAVVHSINGDTIEILKQIANEHKNHNSIVTIAQLQAITPALENINDDYENIYRTYIANADSNISSPATRDEVQQMITEVNALNLPEHAIVDRSFFTKTNGVFEHRFVYLAVESNTTGRTWINNNLGAEYANLNSSDYNPSQQATAIKDLLANGSLFQWGRKADGHELIEWSTLSGKYGTTTIKSDNPDDSLLITGSDDWRVTSDDTLWASESSPNNVCPVGYRLPLNPNGANDGENEWYQETKDLTQNIGGLFHSFLKVSTTGIRNHNGTASIKFSDGGSSNYWSGSVRSDGEALLMGSNWGVLVASDYQVKIAALPVRCIKDQTPAERVATILKEIGNEHSNHKSTVTVAQLKAITPVLENINDEYQDSYRSYIASRDSNFSSPATRDEVQQMINEVNRLVPVSDATLADIATQHSSHKATLTVAQLKAILPALENIEETNEKWYQGYIEGSDTNISSPATIEELQSMIDEVNSFNLPDNAILDKNFYKKTNGKFEHRFVYLPVTNSNTGRTWLNNNLGAWYANVGRNIYNPAQQATNANDNYAKGSLFQWGRKADGHELVTRWWGNGTIDQLATTTTKSDNPTDGKFIAVNSDWRVHPNDDLWKGIDAPNNPCPAHYRVPTKKELDIEAQTWNALTADGSMSSRLKIPGPGWLGSNGYGMYYPGGAPRIWDTTPGVAWRPHETQSLERTNGLPLRCIKEQTPAERSDNILKEIGNEHSSHKSTVTVEELNAITPALENINDDYESSYRIYIANPSNYFSSPATREEVRQMINEVNRLVSASEATRTLIATQHSSHKATLTVAQLKAINLLKNIQDNNEKFYQNYIEGADTHFSSPATIEELQSMIDEVNSLNLPDNAILDKNFYKKTDNKFEHRFVYFPVTNSNTGRTWLNNNLGADYANLNSSDYNPSQQATAGNDHLAYGSLFQWGRKADGHELINWTGNKNGTKKYGHTQTKSNDPSNSLYIIGSNDWRVYSDDTLWASKSSKNSVCPVGYRLPLDPNGANDGENEWYQETQTWSSKDPSGAINSVLKLPMSGFSYHVSNDDIGEIGNEASYWFGSANGSKAKSLDFYQNNVYSNANSVKTYGFNVRCIKDQMPAERSVSILKEIGNEHSNHKSTVTVAQLKAITPALENINDEYENIYRTYIEGDIYFSSPATRDEVQRMLNEVNTLELLATRAEENILELPAHAILDRSFFKKTNGVFEHRFIYLPVTNSTTGRTWLNNNLGAEYANMDSSKYNPAQQAKSRTDYYAYGSEFQWGRKADGHELMIWTDGTHGRGKYGTTRTKNDNPTDSLFIGPNQGGYNWNIHSDHNLWKGVDAPNNPCPIGYRLPTHDHTEPAGANNEWLEEGSTWKSEDYEGAYDSKLKLTLSGWRNSKGYIAYAETFGAYWSASMDSNGKAYSFANIPSNYHEKYWNKYSFGTAYGTAIRCIKD